LGGLLDFISRSLLGLLFLLSFGGLVSSNRYISLGV